MGVKDELSVGWHAMHGFQQQSQVDGQRKASLLTRAKKLPAVAWTAWTNSSEGKADLQFHDHQYRIAIKIEGKADGTAIHW